jgi:hypothetical protein
MGWLIAKTGAFDAGLMVLVLAAVAGSCAMLPLLRTPKRRLTSAAAELT